MLTIIKPLTKKQFKKVIDKAKKSMTKKPCLCACHDEGAPRLIHDRKCCEAMNGVIEQNPDKTPSETWEKRFDEKFLPYGVIWIRNKELFSAYFHLKPIKDFIKSQVAQAKQEVVEKAEEDSWISGDFVDSKHPRVIDLEQLKKLI